MQDQEAFELLDAHLDDLHLTDEQIEGLRAWLQDHPQHAERAFHRIFLHSFLRRRLHAQRLPVSGERTDLVINGAANVESFTELSRPHTALISGPIRRRRAVLVAGGVIIMGVVVACLWVMRPTVPPPVVNADVYDGFAYPATSIPVATPDGESWPTTGGLQGLAGGTGWSEPWQETGPKVAVIVDHANQENWDPKDMRKFSPLGHTDAQGHVLQTSGLQMRTAMGARSLTSRKFDLTAFPNEMKDENGLGKDGAVIWFSFLAQSYNSTASNNRFTYLQVGSREVSGFRIGKVGAAPSGNWTATGLLTGAQVNLRSSAVPSGEMTFLVTRLEFRPGAEDAAVWINPALGDEPKLEDATLRLSVPDFRFDGVTINANFSTDIDELRFGKTFQAVAPVK